MKNLFVAVLVTFASFSFAVDVENTEQEVTLTPGTSITLTAGESTVVACGYGNPEAEKCEIVSSGNSEFPWRVNIGGSSMGRIWKNFDDAFDVVMKLKRIGQCR